MALTRVYVGAHYPADVLAGLALGAVVTLAGARPGTRLIERLLVVARSAPGIGALAQPEETAARPAHRVR